MFKRQAADLLRNELAHMPAVALLGPRQVGKTTLALEVAQHRPSLYLDLESERDRAKLELLQLEGSQDLAEIQTRMSAIIAEANSRDPWTSRARPTFLYVIYGVILLSVIGSIIGIWWPAEVFQAAENLSKLLNAVPESLWWLFGAGYLGYTGIPVGEAPVDFSAWFEAVLK